MEFGSNNQNKILKPLPWPLPPSQQSMTTWDTWTSPPRRNPVTSCSKLNRTGSNRDPVRDNGLWNFNILLLLTRVHASSYMMKYLVKLWYLTNLETHDARGNSYPNGVIAWWILSLLVTTSAFLAFIHESCHPFAVSVVLAFLFIGLWECLADAGAPNAKYGRWMDDASWAPRWHV